MLADVETVAKSMEAELPHSAKLEIHGQASLMYEAHAELIFGLLAAIVLVYLLIVVNFQSWLDPFVIVTALPWRVGRHRLGPIPDPYETLGVGVDGCHHDDGHGGPQTPSWWHRMRASGSRSTAMHSVRRSRRAEPGSGRSS
ncbi:MAG: efflux RND transporter permease subunit [Nitrospiraceae bacterium]